MSSPPERAKLCESKRISKTLGSVYFVTTEAVRKINSGLVCSYTIAH